MNIMIVKNNTLLFNEFKFKCSIGKKGSTSKKYEGDKKTPNGKFSIGHLYYRKDRIKNIDTKLKKIPIKRKMGWCDDSNSISYNRLINLPFKYRHEKLYRKDERYDLIIPIKYNSKKPIKNRGSAIFIHVTKNFEGTAGCVALNKKDLLILLKLINKTTKISIN